MHFPEWIQTMGRLLRGVLALALLGAVTGAPPALASTDSGTVTFRLTLEGGVEATDGFFIDVRCTGGDFCHDGKQRTVYFCSDPVIVDTVLCKPTVFDFTVAIPTQPIEFFLYRTPDIADPDHEPVLVLSGAWQVHGGDQVISLGYVYPGGGAGGAPLPDTAMAAP